MSTWLLTGCLFVALSPMLVVAWLEWRDHRRREDGRVAWRDWDAERHDETRRR